MREEDTERYNQVADQLKSAWSARDQYERGSSQWESFENQAQSLVDQLYKLNPDIDEGTLTAMYTTYR